MYMSNVRAYAKGFRKKNRKITEGNSPFPSSFSNHPLHFWCYLYSFPMYGIIQQLATNLCYTSKTKSKQF